MIDLAERPQNQREGGRKRARLPEYHTIYPDYNADRLRLVIWLTFRTVRRLGNFTPLQDFNSHVT